MKMEPPERIQSAKAAIDMFGVRSQRLKSFEDKFHLSIIEDLPSKVRELHLSRNDIGRLKDNYKSSEDEISQLRRKLLEAKQCADELALRIKESKARTRAREKEAKILKRAAKWEEIWGINNSEKGNSQYIEVTRELENAKQELSGLKLGVASVVEAKEKVEAEIKALGSKMVINLKTAEELGLDIDEANEEHILVELARIEASKESKEIEAQRETDKAQFIQKMEEARVRIAEVTKEISHSKDLENMLVVTTSDLEVLQTEMTFVREMEKYSKKNSLEDKSKEMIANDLESMTALLKTAKAELDAAKKELASLKKEGFLLMSSMDVVRQEMMHAFHEVSRLKKIEEKADITVQDLNSKLLRAKSKLESISAAVQKTNAISCNLIAALERLQSDIKEAKKEKERVSTEAGDLDLEIKNNSIVSVEERLLAAMQELETAKASESEALDMLKTQSEKSLESRASLVPQKSTITITKFEYDYLSKCAAGAQELADQKITAAHAWVEALRASEKEVMLKTEECHKELIKVREFEKKELDKYREAVMVENADQLKRKHSQSSKLHLTVAPPRKSLKDDNVAFSRKSKMHKQSLSSERSLVAENQVQHNKKLASDSVVAPMRKSFKESGRTSSLKRFKIQKHSFYSTSRSPLIILRKRRKVMPSVVMFLKGKRSGKKNLGT